MDRVLIVTPGYLPRLGGMERQVALLAGEFRRRGLAVTVLTEQTYPDLPLREELDGVDVVRLRTRGRRGPLTFALVGLQMAAYLVRHRRAFRFAVIRTLTFPALVTGLLKALRLISYRTLVTAETGGDADDVIALKGYHAWRVFRWVISRNDRLNSICDANYEHYLELGFDSSKLTRIPNGVDMTPFASSRYPEQIKRFAFLGRIERDKGMWELLEAFKGLPDCTLLIAGSGAEEDALKAAAGDGVKFLGRVPYEELGDFFGQSDCLVLPSYSEGLPMAVLEAVAHKRAIVATDVGDLKRLFGDSIFICEPRDPADLKRAMTEAIGGLERVRYEHVAPELSIEQVAGEMAEMLEPPGWKRLWRHSYRLGLRWLLRPRPKGRRVALQRLLVPMDPWRYYELGRVAERHFHGACLDVSSPKLLMSLLQREGRGDWTGIDLFAQEVESWRAVDPGLRLEVEDATALSFADESFDNVTCISVIEHVPGNGDATAMAEMWRVLKPGGTLHLTTNVDREARDVFLDRQLYGEASDESGFFERRYSPQTLDERLLQLPWDVRTREYARQKDEGIEERFYARVPWSYLYGGLLRFRCPRNFETGPELVDHGAVYLELRKPR